MTLLGVKFSFLCGHAREYLIFTCLDAVDNLWLWKVRGTYIAKATEFRKVSIYCIKWILFLLVHACGMRFTKVY